MAPSRSGTLLGHAGGAATLVRACVALLVLAGCPGRVVAPPSTPTPPPPPPDPRLLAGGVPGFEKVPPSIRLGGVVIDREDCRQCHRLLGDGGRRGPELSGLASRRDRAWIVAHFKEPKELTPGSKMPSFRELPEAELQAMADYLLAIP